LSLDRNHKRKVLLAVSDIVAVVASFYLSFATRNYFFGWRGGVYEARWIHAVFLAGLCGLVLLYFRSQYLYRDLAFKQSVEHLETLTRAWLLFAGFFIVVSFFFKVQLFIEHRITVFLLVCLGWWFLYMGRFVLAPLILAARFGGGPAEARILVAGPAREARRVSTLAAQTHGTQMKMVGYVHSQPSPADGPGDIPYLGGFADLLAIVQQQGVTEVFLHLPETDWQEVAEWMKHLGYAGVQIRIAVPHFGALSRKVPHLPGVEDEYLYVHDSAFSNLERAVKRVADAVLAALALLLLAPFMAGVALLIKLESPGPVFFRQKRVGCDDRHFQVYKFRTMHNNTEAYHREAIRRLVEKDEGFFEAQTGAAGLFKVTDERQVTRIGRWLRKSSLDELPQLINVLRGEMSWVGPRPLPEYEVELLKPWQHLRHQVPPGITGLWQVFGRSAVTHEDMILMDVFYVVTWSAALDLRIAIRTAFVLLTGKGAV
jgi:exopolysaccharide biosynthesis polyprenyl glycosylphosphotransferase